MMIVDDIIGIVVVVVAAVTSGCYTPVASTACGMYDRWWVSRRGRGAQREPACAPPRNPYHHYVTYHYVTYHYATYHYATYHVRCHIYHNPLTEIEGFDDEMYFVLRVLEIENKNDRRSCESLCISKMTIHGLRRSHQRDPNNR